MDAPWRDHRHWPAGAAEGGKDALCACAPHLGSSLPRWAFSGIRRTPPLQHAYQAGPQLFASWGLNPQAKSPRGCLPGAQWSMRLNCSGPSAGQAVEVTAPAGVICTLCPQSTWKRELQGRGQDGHNPANASLKHGVHHLFIQPKAWPWTGSWPPRYRCQVSEGCPDPCPPSCRQLTPGG